jgi:flagellar hook-associated protein 2
MSSISSIGFTAGGIDVNQIVSGLMAAERSPQTVMSSRQASVTLQSTALGRIRTNLLSLQSLAANLVMSGLSKVSSTVSSSVATASAAPTANPGALTFTIDRLAAASGIRTAQTVASNTAVITTATSLAVSSTAGRIGASTIQVGAGTTNGQYTVSVTQATAGATQTGTAALAGSTLIDGTNNTLDLQIDGVARTLTLAAGTYTAAGLATAVQTALDSTGGGAKATLDGSGRLAITTAHEGSAATLQVVGGSAATALQLAAGSSSGLDGSIRIGTNPPVAITSAGNGDTISVSTGSGSLSLRLDGGARVGDSTVAVVSTGDRSLASVAAAINGANVGVSAAAVKVADGAWLLQMSSAKSGVANSISVDGAQFSGGLVQTAAGQDAKITIGTGAGAYSVVSSTNAFSDVMPGVTINVNAVSATPTTVSVGRDSGATADAVGALVAAATSLLADISMQTSYNTTTKKASPLSSDAAVKRLADQVRAAVTAIVGAGSPSLAGNAGITLKKDGTLNFDRAKFIAAFDANPGGVERLFARGGTSVGGASWAAATDKTVAGSYGVVVTTAPVRATSGDILIGGSAAGQTIGVKIGATTATYQAAPGASAADIVAGLNVEMAKAGLKVNAELSGGGVRLTAVGFGAAGSFQTNLDVTGAGSWTANTGTDVVGTIDGKTAIGVGNRLSLLEGNASPARGLGLDIAEGVSGTIGPVEYQPGIAARLVALATVQTGANGGLTTSAGGYESRIKTFNDQIARFELRMVAKEAQYRRQWTAVQSSLSALQSQGTWLSSQIDGLPKIGND